MIVNPYSQLAPRLKVLGYSDDAVRVFRHACERALIRNQFLGIHPIWVLWSIVQWESTPGLMALEISCGSSLRHMRRAIRGHVDCLATSRPESEVDIQHLTKLIHETTCDAEATAAAYVGTQHLVRTIVAGRDVVVDGLLAEVDIDAGLLRCLPIAPAECEQHSNPDHETFNHIHHLLAARQAMTDDLSFLLCDAVDRSGRRSATAACLWLMILWTMLRWEKRLAVAILEACGVDLDLFERDVEFCLGVREACRPMVELVSDGLVAIVRDAAAQASSLGADYLGAEHILLALLASDNKEAQELWARHRLTYRNYRAELLRILA